MLKWIWFEKLRHEKDRRLTGLRHTRIWGAEVIEEGKKLLGNKVLPKKLLLKKQLPKKLLGKELLVKNLLGKKLLPKKLLLLCFKFQFCLAAMWKGKNQIVLTEVPTSCIWWNNKIISMLICPATSLILLLYTMTSEIIPMLLESK